MDIDKAQAGSFPEMSSQDIVEALSAWGLPIAKEQLQRPNTDLVTRIYALCLERITQVNDTVLEEPLQEAVEGIDDPELKSGAAQDMLFMHHLINLAQAAQIQDFSSADLVFPERGRTLVLLSAFINYVSFYEDKCVKFLNSLKGSSKSLYNKRDGLRARAAEVEAEIKALEKQIARERPELERLQAESAEITKNLFACKEAQSTMLKEIDMLKQERKPLVEKKEALTVEANNLANTITRQRGRIVQSPERLKRTIVNMGTTAAEDKKIVAANEAKIKDLEMKITACLTIERDVRACVEQLQVFSKEHQTLEVHRKALSDFTDAVSAKTREMSEMLASLERSKDQHRLALEKYERVKRHAQERKVANQSNIERLQREYDAMVSERAENEKQVEQLWAEVRRIEEEMADHIRHREVELNELLAAYWRVRHENDVYMKVLSQQLNMPTE